MYYLQTARYFGHTVPEESLQAAMMIGFKVGLEKCKEIPLQRISLQLSPNVPSNERI